MPAQSRLLRALRPHTQRACRGSFKTNGVFQCAVRAALSKAFDFALHVAIPRPEPFFLTATLRGICEDLIVLSFLAPLPDHNEILLAVNQTNLAEGMKRQEGFFAANRAWQPVIAPEPGFVEQAFNRLKTVADAHGWNRGRLPTVQFMADSSGFRPLYDFMYSATSKWVHCTPHLLLRMGWSNTATRHQLSDETEWIFSTRHFTRYYNDFNRIYGGYLLVRLVRRFLSEFDQPERVERILSRFEKANEDELRWPELVTYEEMNHDGPGPLTRILLRAKSEIEKGEARGA